MTSYLESLFSLSGRTALLTGGTRGIGAAIALALTRAGADLVLIQRDARNTATRSKIEDLGGRATVYECDLADAKAVGELTPKILSDGHDVSILVTCAGIQRRAPSHEFPQEDWDEVLQVNLTTVFELSRSIGAYMLSRPASSTGHRGNIVHLASLLSFQGGLTVPAYAAAKSGVAALTRSLSNEWASKGINVNAIAPGYINTEMNEALMKDEKRRRAIEERIPAGRWGLPEDFEAVTVWLCGRSCGYVSGEVVVVDGGWMGR